MEDIKRLHDIPGKKDLVRKIISDIEEVDEIIKRTYQFRDVYDQIANFVFTKSRSAKETVEVQQTLELLASNDLFIKAAQFQHL